ncbi:MAG: response regulator [Bryobacteraceae bacterium]
MQRVEHEFWKRADVARLLVLAEAERRYFQDILAALPVAVAVAARDGSLRAANRAFRELFGLQTEEVAHADVSRLLPGAPVAEWIREVIDTGSPVEDCELMTGEGGEARRFVLLLDRAPAWQGERREEALLTVLELREEEPEETEGGEEEEPEEQAPRTQAEGAPRAAAAEIERAKRAALERLAARVAHVANNLLMIIGGYGEEILESLPEGDVRRAGMAEILKAAERLGRITKDLNALTVAQEYDAAPVKLSQWMRGHMAEWAEWGVDVELPAPELCAQTSEELLGRVVLEAARYLRHALGDGARLRLRARAAGRDRVELRLEWADAVLSEDARERFFEPFAGQKAGTDPPLGLAGVVKSWERMGGTLELEERALVAGCPRAESAEEREAAVLLVDDEPGIRALIRRALEREGVAVMEAGSAQEALELCERRESPPAALVTDLTMPGISGRELAGRLRMRWPEMRVLFITGYAEQQELATEDEKTRLLHKPFTTARLVEEVRRLLEA